MNEEFNKEFLELSEKDQKAIINLIQFKNMNKKDEYKKRIDEAIKIIKEYKECNWSEYDENEIEIELIDKILEILKGKDNE